MSNRYQAVTAPVIDMLKAIVGEKAVIYDDREKMADYSYDEATRKNTKYQHMPEVVVMPSSTDQVSKILKLANEHLIPVTPRGAGSGLSGGAVPVHGGIVLCMEKMNRILEIDCNNLMAVVEAGVITNELNQKAQEKGLFFAGYPMSFETCSIGGNVAHNAGGGRAIKYGVTSHHILGLEVVLPTGEIVNYGGKRVKDVTGYNMVQLMLGAEGTLGVVTKVIVKLLPLPRARAVMLVLFKELNTAIDLIPKIIGEMRVIPAAIEFMDGLCIDITYNFLGLKKPHREANALLIIEVDGDDQDLVRNRCLDIGDFCMGNGALEAFVAETPKEQEDIWRIRIACPEAIKSLGSGMEDTRPIIEDIVVPPENIPELIRSARALCKKYQIIAFYMGHAGDGNIHITGTKRPELPMEQWETIVLEFLTELYSKTRELGGTISGEHGIAHKRKPFLPLVMGEDEINSMRKIKMALDPNNILNPGKKFDLIPAKNFKTGVL